MTSRSILLAVGGAGALALAAGAMLAARDDEAPFRNSPSASATLDRIDPARQNALDAAALTPHTASPVLPPAATREEAVHVWLDALLTSDTAASFSSLSAADRAAYGSLASWEHALAELPHYLGYAPAGTDDTVVRTAVTIEPRLDEVAGFVPEKATVAWVTVAEDGGYRVSLTESVTEPELPSDDAAVAAAQAWVTAQQTCEPGATYEGNLLGQPVLAGSLCRAAGTFTARAPLGLERFRDPAILLSAFGADAATFVRVVPVDGPIPFQLALAPFADTWEVVGLMEA